MLFDNVFPTKGLVEKAISHHSEERSDDLSIIWWALKLENEADIQQIVKRDIT